MASKPEAYLREVPNRMDAHRVFVMLSAESTKLFVAKNKD
jgi:hypothetical protein